MSRLASILVLALLAACASGPPSSVRVSRPVGELSAAGVEGTLLISREAPNTASTFAAPPAAVWTALKQLFEELKIRPTSVDEDGMTITSIEQRTRSIDGRRILDYLGCTGTYGSENTYDVYLTVRTQLLPGAGGSTLASTQVIGTGRPPLSNSRLQCPSTGALEQLIAAKLGEKLGQPAPK